jgi:hypothetical protein
VRERKRERERERLELLLYGSPDYEFDINIKLFEAVHTYIAATKRFAL